MTHETAIDAIVTALEAVPGIGQVHPYRRFITKADEARDAFKASDDDAQRVQFADVDWSRGAYAPDDWNPTLAGQSTVTVRLYRSLNDADESGVTFRGVVEAAAYVLSEAAGAASVPCTTLVSVEVVTIDHRAFAFPGIGDVLVHYAELRAPLAVELVAPEPDEED